MHTRLRTPCPLAPPHPPTASDMSEARAEAATLVDLLGSRHRTLAATLDGNFPELRR